MSISLSMFFQNLLHFHYHHQNLFRLRVAHLLFLDDLFPECWLTFFEGLTYKDQQLPILCRHILVHSRDGHLFWLIVTLYHVQVWYNDSNVNMENDLSVAEFDQEIENIIWTNKHRFGKSLVLYNKACFHICLASVSLCTNLSSKFAFT